MGKEIEVRTAARHFTGSNSIDLDPPAPMAPGLTAKRLGLEYRLAEIFDGYTRESLARAQESCVWGSCELNLLTNQDDGGNTSTAKYHCPKAKDEQGCTDRATAAAARVIEQTDTDIAALSRAIDTISAQGPTEVFVTINHTTDAVAAG